MLNTMPCTASTDFLPGYRAVTETDPFETILPKPNLLVIDHVVGNQPDMEMEDVAEWWVRLEESVVKGWESVWIVIGSCSNASCSPP